jgi:hypothetical protein
MRFLFGSQNFGLDTIDSDKDYVQVLYPYLGDLCKAIPHSKESKNVDGSITKNIDIRAIPSLFYKSNLDIVQLLYSKEVIEGGFLEEYFCKYENELSTMNLPRFYQSVMGSAINRYKRKTSKDLAHIVFGFKTLIQFEEQSFTNLRKCFEHGERDLYRAIRSESYDSWLISAQEWEKLALKKKETYMNLSPNDRFKEQMDKDIGNIVIQQIMKENEKA